MLDRMLRMFGVLPTYQPEPSDSPITDWSFDRDDPLLREFEGLEADARRRTASEPHPDHVRGGETAPSAFTCSQVNTDPGSKAAGDIGRYRTPTAGDGFDNIPRELRNRALMWFKRREIVALFSAGKLESRLDTIEAHNRSRATSAYSIQHSTRIFEGRATLSGEDATTEYPAAFRENGRFGSPSSHEDYSDEGRA